MGNNGCIGQRIEVVIFLGDKFCHIFVIIGEKIEKIMYFLGKKRKEVWNIYLFSVHKNSPLLQTQKFKKKQKKENTTLRPPSIYVWLAS
jgi:hypothetical protein